MIIIELYNGFKCRYKGSIDIKFGSSCGVPALLIEAHSRESYFNGEEDDMIIWMSDVYDYIYLDDIKSITCT